MSPLMRSFAGMAVRASMLLLGATGVDLAPDDRDSVMQAVEMVVNGLLIAVPLLWSAYQKWDQQEKLKSAELTAELAQLR